MSASNPPLPAAQAAFHVVAPTADEIGEAARAWDAEFRPLEGPRFESLLLQTQAVDSPVLLSYARLGARVDQRGAAPPGRRTFALLASGAPEISWCGERTTPDTLMSFDSGGDFESSTPAGFEVYTLSVCTEHLESIAAREELGSLQRMGSDARRVALSPGEAGRLQADLARVTRWIERDPTAAADPALRETIEEEIAGAMLLASLGHALEPRPASAAARQHALRRALDFIDAHAAEAPRIADLCLAAGASERTLRYAFAERFSMSPKSYLQAVRLNGVRRDLRSAASRPSVSDAANRWGFWHMGQFAADYRRLFGELPSSTLAGRR